MAISFQCVCGQHITTREDRAGAIQKCPSCKMSVLVPGGPREPIEPPLVARLGGIAT